MTKKHFIALADAIREHNANSTGFAQREFTATQLDTLAQFCQSSNERFNRERWIGYIKGENGKNGGKII